jgi:hypothetical protein
MSHKTIYIDVDEEITSIIDRIRKAQVSEIIVVVPKQALLIQSLVNLKLLKKEADRRKKRIMIVTQDRIGKKLIEKAGILVQRKEGEDLFGDEDSYISEKGSRKKTVSQKIIDEDDQEADSIGTSDYFEKSIANIKEPENNIGKIRYENFEKKDSGSRGVGKNNSEISEKTPEFMASNVDKLNNDAKISMSDIVMGSKQKEKRIRRKKEESQRAKGKTSQVSEKSFVLRESERQKSIETDRFFRMPAAAAEQSSRQREKVMKTTKIKGRAGKYFVIFAIVLIILLTVAGAYFYLPRATLAIELSRQEKSISENIKASTSNTSIDPGQSAIPAAIEKISIEKSEEISPTGNKTNEGKASGSVVIYNEFSAENQSLVATTRLETADGKIFRINNNVFVPGITQVAGENKPGAIEISVTADKAGEGYNIDPSDFKIVGFKGGPKYDKIYAKSVKPMTGGGLSGGGIGTITASDIANAKEKLLVEAKKDAIQKLKDSLGSNRRFFNDNVRINVTSASSTDAIGAQVEKFTYKISGEAQAISYSEEDVKSLMDKNMSSDVQSSGQIKFDKPINYILADANFQDGTLSFAAKTDATLVSAIDLDKFKHGILGKNTEELTAFIKTYPSIKNADISYSPFFVSRVPMRENRVNIEVK